MAVPSACHPQTLELELQLVVLRLLAHTLVKLDSGPTMRFVDLSLFQFEAMKYKTKRCGTWPDISLVFQICTFLKGATTQWIDDQNVPYAIKNSDWVGYDNKKSYETKVCGTLCSSWADYISSICNKPQLLFYSQQVRYLQDQKYGGAFVWALDLDDFAGRFCGEGSHPLLAHLRKLMDIGKSFLCCSTKTNLPLNLLNVFVQLYFNLELPPLPPTTTPKPGASTTTRPTTTTTTTTPIPGSGFCNGKPDGLYANPDNKNSFYMCSGGITYVRFCGTGSVFDDSCKCCAWP